MAFRRRRRIVKKRSGSNRFWKNRRGRAMRGRIGFRF